MPAYELGDMVLVRVPSHAAYGTSDTNARFATLNTSVVSSGRLPPASGLADDCDAPAMVTSRARVVRWRRSDDDGADTTAEISEVELDVDSDDGRVHRIIVSARDFWSVNAPHRFAALEARRCGVDDDVLLFEDGIRCAYAAPLMRARLCEMAFVVEATAQRIDWSKPNVRPNSLCCCACSCGASLLLCLMWC
jgi:hypothetical protein